MTIEYLSNEDIPFENFVLISDSGENFGKKTKQESLKIAEERGLDLVLVNDNSSNPVCKILDLKKKIYNDKIKEKENKSFHKKRKTKEVRLSVHTDEHDLETKAKNINKFLKEESRVKINIRFPKRQRTTIQSVIKSTFESLIKKLSNELEFEISSGSYSDSSYLTELIPKIK